MNRIQRAFERRFRELLGELGAREREKGVNWLFRHAQTAGQTGANRAEGQERSRRLAEENIALAEKVRRFKSRRGSGAKGGEAAGAPPVICDAGLGGLARWLRAAGWDARWEQDITDARLVSEAQRLGAVLITTDSFILDRRPVVRGEVAAIWVPPALNRFEQLRLVLAELGSGEFDSRCMKCGGALREIKKEAVRDRIPPKTLRWLEEYYECERCHQLFWHGTHWERIAERLNPFARKAAEITKARRD